MNQFCYVLSGMVPVMRCANMQEAKALEPVLAVKFGVAAVLHEADLSEPQTRSVRAALKLLEAGIKAEELVTISSQINEARDADPVLSKRDKNRERAVREMFSALDSFVWEKVAAPVAKRAMAPRKAPRSSVKDHIRSLFPRVDPNQRLTPNHLNNAGFYTASAVQTALCDLKNPKYAGDGGVIVIKRHKVNDTITYSREA